MINKQCVGEFNGRRLYTGPRLDYRLRLYVLTSALRDISAITELLLVIIIIIIIFIPSVSMIPRDFGNKLSEIQNVGVTITPGSPRG